MDQRGIGLAAALIGTMGIIDDVAATQVAAVDELRQGARRESDLVIATRALSIGRAHIAAVINTLPLAYFAAALPLVVSTLIAPGDLLTRISIKRRATAVTGGSDRLAIPVIVNISRNEDAVDCRCRRVLLHL